VIAVINESGRKKRGGCRSQEQQGGKEEKKKGGVFAVQMEEKLEAAWSGLEVVTRESSNEKREQKKMSKSVLV